MGVSWKGVLVAAFYIAQGSSQSLTLVADDGIVVG
jgi:hypothetical protein